MASALQAKIQSLGQKLKEENQAGKRDLLGSEDCKVGTLTRPVLELKINSRTRTRPGECNVAPAILTRRSLVPCCLRRFLSVCLVTQTPPSFLTGPGYL